MKFEVSKDFFDNMYIIFDSFSLILSKIEKIDSEVFKPVIFKPDYYVKSTKEDFINNKDKVLDRILNSFKFDGSFEKVSGMAFHWYTGDHFENIELLRKMFPNKLLIHTEGCTRLLCF